MNFVLAALSGIALVLSFSPFGLWPLTVLAAAGLFWSFERDPARVIHLGTAYTLAKYGFGVSWVYVSINVYGNAPPPLAVFLVVLMVLILTAVAWVFWWVYARARCADIWGNAALFTVVWLAGEWSMTWAFSGFPWLFAGYAHITSPLAGYAPIGGVLLVSAASVLCGVALVIAVLQEGRARFAALATVVGLLLVGFGLAQIEFTESRGERTFALVQGNTDQATKWNQDQQLPILRNHLALSATHWGDDLVVWPESAITFSQLGANDVLEDISTRARDGGTAFVTGIPWLVPEDGGGYRFYNSAIGLGMASGIYLKQHLVPFGEYVPFQALLRGLIDFFDLPMSSMSVGQAGQDNLNLGGYQGAMLICYEIAFPELTRRQSAGAQVLLTISNDTWFGGSIGPAQHLQIAQMRALELGRWLLRGTNNGLTAAVDHRGRLVDRLPQFASGVLTGTFEVRDGATPYASLGLVPLALLLVLLAGVFAYRRHLLR